MLSTIYLSLGAFSTGAVASDAAGAISLVFACSFYVYSTCFHIHNQPAPTWTHVSCVNKIAYPTSWQQLRRSPNPKSNLIHKPTCGSPKTATPTQRLKEQSVPVLRAIVFPDYPLSRLRRCLVWR